MNWLSRRFLRHLEVGVEPTSFSSNLQHQQRLFPKRTFTGWIWCLFWECPRSSWLCGESQEISSFRTAASIVCQPDARLQLQPALWVLYWDLRHRSWLLLWDPEVLVAVLDVCSVPIFPFWLPPAEALRPLQLSWSWSQSTHSWGGWIQGNR